MGLLASRDVFSWLLMASVFQVSSVRLAQGTYLCTAYLNISYTIPETNLTTWLREEMGLYGQDSPKTSVVGNVYLADPIYGCEDDTVYRRPNDSRSWIALIQRGNGCTFADKINVAAMNGAAAAIIFNDFGADYRVIQMSHPGSETRPKTPRHAHILSSVCLFSFFQKKLKAEAKKAIGQLQVRTLRQGDQETGPDADACAVCIELYKPGDVLSVLTCNHFFHKSCIEPWLLEHRTCPMCKCDILKALGVEMDVEEQPQISVPDFRSFSTSEDLQSETVSHTHSETASSGYASMHGNEHLGSAEPTTVYEMAFESIVQLLLAP
uniref:Ring finger protein 128a n=1 Tax=Sinocyclocheilus grahami TaxID=75366 RepID=A0A672LNW1_SINGR